MEGVANAVTKDYITKPYSGMSQGILSINFVQRNNGVWVYL